MRVKCYLILLMLILGCGAKVLGFEPQNLNFYQNLTEINRLKQEQSGVLELYGEIIDISADSLQVLTDKGTIQLNNSFRTKFFCNGTVSNWVALRPVTEEAFFEAQILYKGNQVIAINGFYYGEECLVRSWQNQGNRIVLELFAIGREESFFCLLSENVQLPKKNHGECTEQVVYVLYNIKGEIRSVYWQ